MPLDASNANKLRVGNLIKVTLRRLHNDSGASLPDVEGIKLDVYPKGGDEPMEGAADLPFLYVAESEAKYVASIPSTVEFVAGSTYTLVISGPDYRDEFDMKAVKS